MQFAKVSEVRRRELVPGSSRRFGSIVFRFHNGQRRKRTCAADGTKFQINAVEHRGCRHAMTEIAFAVRVPFRGDRLEFGCMFGANAIVPAFPNANRRMVAVVNDHVTEGISPRCPSFAKAVFFTVDPWHDGHEAVLVT